MFEGKEIIYVTICGKEIPAIVVACVKDIGITIVSKEDNKKLLYCCKGKKAPNFSTA